MVCKAMMKKLLLTVGILLTLLLAVMWLRSPQNYERPPMVI